MSRGTRKARIQCCYGNCSNGEDTDIVNSGKIFFVEFPKPFINPEKCERWIGCCGNSKLTSKRVTSNTYICSIHFVGGNGPTNENPDPIPLEIWGEDTDLTRKRKNYSAKKMSKAKLPKTRTPRLSEKLKALHETMKKETDGIGEVVKTQEIQFLQQEDGGIVDLKGQPVFLPNLPNDKDLEFTLKLGEDMLKNLSTAFVSNDQTNETEFNENKSEYSPEKQVVSKDQLLNRIDNVIARCEYKRPENPNVAEYCYSALSQDSAKFRFYTAMSLPEFDALYNYMKDDAEILGSTTSGTSGGRPSMGTLTPKDKLIMVMTKLKLCLVNRDLGYRYKVSQTTVSKVLQTWIPFLFLKLEALKEDFGAAGDNPKHIFYKNYELLRLTIIDHCKETEEKDKFEAIKTLNEING